MKLRVRSCVSRLVINVCEESVRTATELKIELARRLPELKSRGESREFDLSLNGQDKFSDENGETTLRDLGLVDGDLIHILCSDPEYLQLPLPREEAGPVSNQQRETNQGAKRCKISTSPQPSTSGSSSTNMADRLAINSQRTTNNTDNVSNISDSTRASALSQCQIMEVDEQNLQTTNLQTTDEQAKTESTNEMSEIISFLNEPLLVRDSTEKELPSIIGRLYQGSEVNSKIDALCIVVHALMVECGFSVKQPTNTCQPPSASLSTEPSTSDTACHVSHNPSVLLTLQPTNTCQPPSTSVSTKSSTVSSDTVSHVSLPPDWKRSTANVITYRHRSCDGSCDLICVPIGQSVIAHACLEGEDTHTLQVKPDEFVENLSQDVTTVYKRLPVLSRLFMDAIGLPLQQDICALQGQPFSIVGFMALPHEIKIQILCNLDVVSLLRLSEVSTYLQSLTEEPFLWRRLYLVTYGSRSNNDLCQDWKKLYIEEYRRRKIHQTTSNRFLSSDNTVLWPFRPLPFYARPPRFGIGGIVGGDYDLQPAFEYRDTRFIQRDPPQPGDLRPLAPPIEPHPFLPLLGRNPLSALNGDIGPVFGQSNNSLLQSRLGMGMGHRIAPRFI